MGAENGNGEVEKLDLVGTFEAHLILGVERSRIARFLAENGQGKDKIPVPVAEPKCGPIWLRAQIERRAAQMYAAAGSPYGKTKAGLDRWIVERALVRAEALPKPLSDEELSRIIGRSVPIAA